MCIPSSFSYIRYIDPLYASIRSAVIPLNEADRKNDPIQNLRLV